MSRIGNMINKVKSRYPDVVLEVESNGLYVVWDKNRKVQRDTKTARCLLGLGDNEAEALMDAIWFIETREGIKLPIK